MAARRQDAWEAALKEKAFLSETIKPIVDDTATFKPPIPYALREVKRSMDKGIRFKNNTYGLLGLPETRIRRLFANMATGLSGLKSLLGTSQNAMRGSAIIPRVSRGILHLGVWHSG